MTVGERGGSTTDLWKTERLQEEHKVEWRNKIKWAIVEALVDNGHFHADFLVHLKIPAEYKNMVDVQIICALHAGIMSQTNERRRSVAIEGHGRKSFVYRITQKGIDDLPAKAAKHRGGPVPTVPIYERAQAA